MKKYLINVNGSSYEVEVEELKEGSNFVAPAPSVSIKAEPKVVIEPAAVPEKPKSQPVVSKGAAAADGTQITAPMPGVIWKVMVNVGDDIEVGQVVCVLEAMKMENDIVTPVAGKVAGIYVRDGETVNSGDLMAVIE